jgi:hypothetical protein
MSKSSNVGRKHIGIIPLVHGDNDKECICLGCKQYRVRITEYNESAYKLAWVRYAEALTESTPQWCLQIYIVLRQWDFPWLTVLLLHCNFTMHYIAAKLVISKIQLDISMSSCVLLIILLLNINICMAKEYLRQQKVFTNCR